MKKILLFSFFLISLIGYSQRTASVTGNWSNSATWGGSSVPNNTHAVTINSGITVTVDANATAASIDNNAGTLTLNANLTVSGNTDNDGYINVTGGNYISSGASATFTNAGPVTIGSAYYLQMSGTSSTLTNNYSITTNATSTAIGRVILSGTLTHGFLGSGSYSRYINGLGDAGTSTGWDLIGSPVSDLSINSFIATDNDGEIATSGTGNNVLYSVGFYDASDNDWETYGGSATENPISSAGNFTVGKGYQMAVDGGGVVQFKGTLNTGDKDIDIISGNESGSGTRWNLVSNPYLSYINANDNDDGTNNVLSVNQANLHSSNTALYFWDGDEYITVDHNTSSGYQYIAPMQGFMVGTDVTVTTVNFDFTKAMQTTSGSDDAIQNSPMDDDIAELFIGINQNNIDRKTEIYFNEIGVDGLTPGYDAAAFASLDIYVSTRLVETTQETEGLNFYTQSLAYDEMWDKVVPIAVNALSNQELRLYINHSTIPADLNIFLEDAVEGTYTNLKQEDFVLTPTSDLSDAGRFYIHLTADTLSDEEVNTSLLNAYKKVDQNYITIEGLATQSTNTEVSLFNILGTKVMDATLDNTSNTQMISTNGLSTGIYVIKLESGQNQLTKKLIIK